MRLVSNSTWETAFLSSKTRSYHIVLPFVRISRMLRSVSNNTRCLLCLPNIFSLFYAYGKWKDALVENCRERERQLNLIRHKKQFKANCRLYCKHFQRMANYPRHYSLLPEIRLALLYDRLLLQPFFYFLYSFVVNCVLLIVIRRLPMIRKRRRTFSIVFQLKKIAFGDEDSRLFAFKCVRPRTTNESTWSECRSVLLVYYSVMIRDRRVVLSACSLSVWGALFCDYHRISRLFCRDPMTRNDKSVERLARELFLFVRGESILLLKSLLLSTYLYIERTPL